MASVSSPCRIPRPLLIASRQPGLPSPDSCVLSAINDALENICTLYGYDDAGNQITTTNALNQISLTVYDSANRPVITVRNLVLGKAENGTVRLSAAEQIPFV